MDIFPEVATKTRAVVAATMTTAGSTPDVWQQLQDWRIGVPLTRLVSYIVALPELWEPAPTTQTAGVSDTTGTTNQSDSISSSALPGTPEGTQLFGLFVSRYFLLAVLIGFIISRIHVLVHRQRVRPLGILVRVAVYMPTHLLLLRTLFVVCTALSNEGQTTKRTPPWMQTPIEHVAKFAREQSWMGIGGTNTDPRNALWLSFATTCLFDCVDVFVARLEGSPCAPYEYIGGLIERTSLYYFYGGSLRIQELALLNVLEKLLLSHMLIMVTNGWQWRLVPTGTASLLMLHHFVFSMRNYAGSQAMYPFVQVMSMVLLGMSLLIVLTTVSIRWLAHTVDRLGIKPRRSLAASARGPGMTRDSTGLVAVYNRDGVFQGIQSAASNDTSEIDGGNVDGDDDDSLYELTRDSGLPLFPDMRRDFSVEILDLAGTCLQQYSNQIRSSGFSRQCGAMRLPLKTALDEYIDKEASRFDSSDAADRSLADHWAAASRFGRSGMSVLIDDEPSVLTPVQSSVVDIAAAIRDTRINSIRRLSVSAWSLCVAIGYRALDRKMASRDTGVAHRHAQETYSRNVYPRLPEESARFEKRKTDSALFETSRSSWGNEDGEDDEDEDFDFDFVEADDSDSDTELEDGSSASDSEVDTNNGNRFSEAAELVCDILDNSEDGSTTGGQLAAAAAFIVHTLFDGTPLSGIPNRINANAPAAATAGGSVMTRGMFARQLSLSQSAMDGVNNNGSTTATANPGMLILQMLTRAVIPNAGGNSQHSTTPNLPFSSSEIESLAQLIQTRRLQNQSQSADPESASSDTVLCVICWANTRSVMLRPCRCLCLCNDCRMALAARSFDHCPCCRRPVAGYSRVYAV